MALNLSGTSGITGAGIGTIGPSGANITGVGTFTQGHFTDHIYIADTIVHTGDTNTKIRFPTNDTVTVETGGSERIRIDSSGRMMIGNTSADSLYSVANNLVVGSGSGSEGLTIFSDGNNDGFVVFADGTSDPAYRMGQIIYSHQQNRFHFRTNGNTDRLLIDSNGNTNISGITTATTFVPTAQPYGTRNYVINGDMRIAQRYTSTTSINEYIVDRWRSYGGALGATWSQQTDATAYPRSRYALRQHRTASNSQTNNTGVGQGIETKNSLPLAGQTVTLSFKARCGANFSASSNYLTSRINGGEGTDENPFGMTNTNGDAQNNTLTTSVQSFTQTWTIPSDKTQITVLFDYTPVGTAGANDWFEIAEVQLEVGSVATPFEYRSYDEELARCQRYYYLHGTGAGNYGLQGTGMMGLNASTVTGKIIMWFPVPMRTKPSATWHTANEFRNDTGLAANDSTFGAIWADATSVNSAWCDFPGGSGSNFSESKACMVYSRSGSNAKMAFNAEL